VDSNIAIVAVVGENMRGTPELPAELSMRWGAKM